MAIFFTTLEQMSILFIFMGIGFFLRQKDLLPREAQGVLARLENYLFMPALIFNTFRTNFTLENLMARWDFIFWGVVLLLLNLPLAYLSANLMSKNETAVYRYSFMVSNFAFMGNSLMRGIYGEDALFLYMIYTLPLTFFAYSVGIAWLKNASGAKFSLHALVNPVFFAVILGILLGLTGIPLPSFLDTVVTSSAGCMTPVAMLLTGMVIGSYTLKSFVTEPTLYLASLIRLIVLPVFGISILRFFSVSEELQLVALISFCMPMGLNSIIIPSAYGRDTSLGAGLALISHIFSLLTIPLLLLIFQ